MHDLEAINATAKALTPLEEVIIDELKRLQFHIVVNNFNLLYKVFNDIDTLFFGSHLHGNVYLTDSIFSYICGGENVYILGRTHPRGARARRVAIEFNQLYLRKNIETYSLDRTLTWHLRDTLSTLLHEMVHAYMLVRCGSFYTDICVEPHDDVAHGVNFRRCMTAIQARLDAMGGQVQILKGRQYVFDKSANGG